MSKTLLRMMTPGNRFEGRGAVLSGKEPWGDSCDGILAKSTWNVKLCFFSKDFINFELPMQNRHFGCSGSNS
jgi:hypothetical protein